MGQASSLEVWQSLPGRVRHILTVVGPDGLDHPIGGEGLTVREQVHHVVEANLIAASIVIAALGSPGCTYDWSWMLPFGPWLDRLDYRSKPLEPSLHLLDALNAYVTAQLLPLPDGLDREVYLRDHADRPPRRTTVAEVLEQEVAHADSHLSAIEPARAR